MATGKEIKRLRGKKSAVEVSRLIGVSVDKLRKWEERDVDPSDGLDILKVKNYFGCELSELNNLVNFDFVEKPYLALANENAVNEPQEPYEKTVPSGQMLADLIYSNKTLADAARIQAEAAKIRAEADMVLARNVEDLIAQMKSTTAGDVVQTQIETVAIVKVLQEHIFDLEVQATGKNIREIKQDFYSKVKAVKDPIGKKGSRVDQGT